MTAQYNYIKKQLLAYGISRISAVIVLGVFATAVLIGWGRGTEQFLNEASAVMNPLTAVCFLVTAIGLLCLRTHKFVVITGGLSLFIIGLLQLLGMLEIISWSIDLVLFGEKVAEASVPSRMSEYTAFMFLLLGLIFLGSVSRTLRAIYVPEILAATIFLLTLIAVLYSLHIKIVELFISLFFSASISTIVLVLVSSIALFAELRQKEVAYKVSLLVVGALLALLTASFVGASIASQIITTNANDTFTEQTRIIADSITDRSEIYINVLQGGRGLFAASEAVSRDEWREYVGSLNILENYPGIQGLGYAIFVTPSEKDAHEAAVQAEGFPQYTIRPAGERQLYTSIVYLEPFDIRNQQAFGFDMYQEANRNFAMSTARDTGLPAISAKITLVQEIDDDVQAGFLIYVPQYTDESDIATIEKRQESIVGYVYSPFRARDFIEGAIGSNGVAGIDLIIYDGTQLDTEAILYGQDINIPSFLQPNQFTTTSTITIANRQWTLQFISQPNYAVDSFFLLVPFLVIVGGVAASVMLSALLYLLLASRAQAQALAEKMTINYKRQQQQLDSFHAIVTMPDLHITERIKRTLAIIAKELDLEVGTVSHVTGDAYEVIYQASISDTKMFATTHDLSETYCANVYRSQQLLTSITDTVQEYKPYAFRSYIGAPMTVNDQLFGTVSFYATAKRARFTAEDITFVNLAVRWIARMIESQQIDRSKDEFVSLASHQLRTPLSVINWYTEMLGDDEKGKLSKTQQSYLSEIITGSQRMVKMVNALLNVSRLDLGTYTIDPQPVVLTEVLDEVVRTYAVTTAEKKIVVTKDVDTSVPELQADRELLKIIFDNLFTNALKYTPEEGRVAVTATVVGEEVQIAFVDTGYGIPNDQKEMIFKKMFRATNVQEHDTDGTGLGLYMVRSLLRAAGGSIEFTSEEGVGTTFTITIPFVMKAQQGSSKITSV